jgi:hypothetical protein
MASHSLAQTARMSAALVALCLSAVSCQEQEDASSRPADRSTVGLDAMRQKLAGFREFPIYWTGPTAAGYAVVREGRPVEDYRIGRSKAVSVYYGMTCFELGGDEADRCNPRVQIDNYRLCDKFAAMIDLDQKSIRIQGVPGSIVGLGLRPGNQSVLLYGRDTTVVIYAQSVRQALAIAPELRNPARPRGGAAGIEPYQGHIVNGTPARCVER